MLKWQSSEDELQKAQLYPVRCYRVVSCRVGYNMKNTVKTYHCITVNDILLMILWFMWLISSVNLLVCFDCIIVFELNYLNYWVEFISCKMHFTSLCLNLLLFRICLLLNFNVRGTPLKWFLLLPFTFSSWFTCNRSSLWMVRRLLALNTVAVMDYEASLSPYLLYRKVQCILC